MSIKPRILTVGTGAVGAIYSWRLSKSCHVTTVCRSNYEMVKQNGFNIESIKFGNEVFHPDNVVRTVSEATESFDFVVVTLKALPDIYNVADIIAPAITPNTTIVLIQNGLGIEEPITERFPNNPLVSVVAYIATSQITPGKISMLATESLIVGRHLPSKINSEKERDRFVDLLLKGGVDATSVEDIERLRWQKLFWNAAFSSVCALTGMNTSQLDKEALKVVENVMGEVIDAAIAHGYDFDRAAHMHSLLTRNVKNYKPSMQLDKERRNPMEVEVILGTPLRRAQAKGLHVPHLENIYSLCSAVNTLNLNKKNTSSL